MQVLRAQGQGQEPEQQKEEQRCASLEAAETQEQESCNQVEVREVKIQTSTDDWIKQVSAASVEPVESSWTNQDAGSNEHDRAEIAPTC